MSSLSIPTNKLLKYLLVIAFIFPVNHALAATATVQVTAKDSAGKVFPGVSFRCVHSNSKLGTLPTPPIWTTHTTGPSGSFTWTPELKDGAIYSCMFFANPPACYFPLNPEQKGYSLSPGETKSYAYFFKYDSRYCPKTAISKITPSASPSPTTTPLPTPTLLPQTKSPVGLIQLILSLFRAWFIPVPTLSPTLIPTPTATATPTPEPTPAPTRKPTPRPTLLPKPVIPSGTIPWSTTPLTWDYFQATPQGDYGAEIITRINAQWKDSTSCTPTPPFSCTVRVAQFNIQALMDPKQSWVKPDRKTPELLRHEQGHFDIGEIYARKIRTALAPHIGTSVTAGGDTANTARDQASSQIQSKLNAIIIPLQQAEDQMQTDYDNETGHRIGNPAAQAAWEQEIKSML